MLWRGSRLPLSFVSLLTLISLSVACVYKRPAAQAPSIPNLPSGVALDLPKDLEHPDLDAELAKESAIIISIAPGNQLYLGRDRVLKEELSDRLVNLLKSGDVNNSGGPAARRIIYVAAGNSIDYQAVVDVLDLVRRHDVDTVGLIAGRKPNKENASETTEARSRFLVMIPRLPKPDEDLSNLRPNMLTLVVSFTEDLRLKLNTQTGPQEGEPCASLMTTYGSVSDPQPLAKCLSLIFQRRAEEHAFKPGFEKRDDLPLSERTEKTIFIKAPGSTRFGNVVRTIDALKGAGASPIGMQIGSLQGPLADPGGR